MRRGWVVFGLGLAGLLSLLAFPFEALAPTSMPPLLFRALALLQPAAMTAAAALAGALLARRVGLTTPLIDALLARRDVGSEARRILPAAVVAGVLTAGVLVAYAAVAAPYFASAGSRLPVAALDPPLIARVLYGGLTEEVLLRWGFMTLIVWLAAKAMRASPPRPAAYCTGIALAAGLFAIGHLPLLYLLTPEPPGWMLAMVLAGNAVPGLLFGWLYWRRGLEAAMLAHALAHVLAVGVGRVIG